MPKGKPYAYDGATKQKNMKLKRPKLGKHKTVKVPRRRGRNRGY